MSKDSFVYCWTDHLTNMLYIGSHKGSENDGYVCSSTHMLKEYVKRPHDFTRSIIASGSVQNIRKLESQILQAVNARINEDFYNKHQNDGFYFEGWKSENISVEHRKNMSIAASKRKRSDEHLKKLHDGRRASKNSIQHIEATKKARKGVPMPREAVERSRTNRLKNNDTKMLASHAGKISAQKYKNDPERQKKHSEKMKKVWAERKLKKLMEEQ